jgi:glutaminyl-peptide cyclotransferase
MRKNIVLLIFSGIFLFAGAYLIFSAFRPQPELAPVKFDGEHAYKDVTHQTALGPRIPNSAAHAQIRLWIHEELVSAGWQMEEQIFDSLGHRGYNIVARRGDAPAKIILGAHYDTRIYADRDPDVEKRKQAVLGANDGASGVAVLLELARTIPAENESVWLVFFDLEDNGNLPTWDWILGSRAFVDGYALDPDAVVILDMIGDADLNIHLERNSNPGIRAEIWAEAQALGYEEYFINSEKFSMLDDHTPFLEAGYPAVDVIDFDYPYWHTTEDTADKVSSESLEIVGETILAWIKNRH